MCLLLPSSVPTRHPGQVRGPPFLPFWGRLGGFLSPSGLDTGRGEAAHARALHVHRPVSRRSGVTASERGLVRRSQAHRSWAKVFFVAFLHLAFLHQRIIYILLSVASSPLGLACLVHSRPPSWLASCAQAHHALVAVRCSSRTGCACGRVRLPAYVARSRVSAGVVAVL